MKDLKALRKLFMSYPYPLGMIGSETLMLTERWLNEEAIPNLPYDICRASGLLMRMNAAIAIRSYIDSGMEDSGLNIEIVNSLRAPSDGAWHNLSPKLLNYLSDKSPSPLIQLLHRTLSKKLEFELLQSTNERSQLANVWKNKKKDVSSILGMMVTYRNKVIHGERLTKADHLHALTRLFSLFEAHEFYNKYHVLVKHGDHVFDCDATLPRKLTLPNDPQALWWDQKFMNTLSEIKNDEPFIVHQDNPGDRLNLSPILQFTAQETGHIHMDELLFVNRGTKEAAEYIAYRHEHPMDARTLGNYETFRQFISSIPTPPLAKDKRINYFGLYEFHHERFVGRENVLNDIHELLHSTDKPYLELRALAGMGKTAILAELYGQHGTREHIPWPLSDKTLEEALPPDQDRWAFHFCMARDGRDDPVVALQSIVAQLCDGASLRRDSFTSNELKVQRQKLSECLTLVKQQLNDDNRIFICIDALDEGIPNYGSNSVPQALLGEDEEDPEIPQGVVFLISHRVDENDHGRADDFTDHIPEDWRERIPSANPLAGLTDDDIQILLNKLQKQVNPEIKVPENTFKATWAAATKDTLSGASPFYLRFLGDDVLDRSIDLNRPESIPPDLGTVFEQSWMTLPHQHDYALHRILATLAIMREYGTDEIMHYVVNASRPDKPPLSLDDIRDLRTAAGKLLVYDGDRYGLFHDKFREFLVGPQRNRVDEAVEAYHIVNGN